MPAGVGVNTPNRPVYFELMQDLAQVIGSTNDAVLDPNQDMTGVIPTLMIFNEGKLNEYYTAVRDGVSYILNVRDTIRHNASWDPNYSVTNGEIEMCRNACTKEVNRIERQLFYIRGTFPGKLPSGEPPVLQKLRDLPNNLSQQLNLNANTTAVNERRGA